MAMKGCQGLFKLWDKTTTTTKLWDKNLVWRFIEDVFLKNVQKAVKITSL